MTLQAGKMFRPSDVAFGGNGVIFAVEQFNHRISKWTYAQPSYTFSLDAGQVTSITVTNGGTGYSVADPVNISAPTLNIANPVNAIAEVATVSGDVILTITVTNGGNGYDPNNLPTVDAPTAGTPAILAAVVSTPWGSNGDGTSGIGAPIGDGSPTDTALYRPSGIAFDSTNSRLYVTDTFHDRVRVINSSTGAFVSSFGSSGFSTTNFFRPAGIAINGSTGTTLVIADELNHRAIKYNVNSGAPNGAALLLDPSVTTGLSFIRPHGVVYDVTADEFNIGDSLRGRISSYNVAGAFQNQYGTPRSDPSNTNANFLFYPGSGEGLLSGTVTTVFADTQNNVLKTMNNETLTLTTGTSAGTGDGQLFHPESVAAFTDTVAYVLAANTLNNRVETFSSTAAVLTPQTPFNFGKP